MPHDEPTPDTDSTGSNDQRCAQPAEPGDAPADAEPTPSIAAALAADAADEGGRDPEAQADAPKAGSGSTPEQEPDHDQITGKPILSSEDFGERLLARVRRRDAQSNTDTRPPADELVTFRSLTINEIYAGQAIDSLTTALATIEWVNFDEPIVEQIAEARKGYQYSRLHFWLLSEPPDAPFVRHGRTSLPSGIDHVYGECYVLGPSIVAVVLTFVLADDEALKLNGALRDDAESRLDRLGDRKTRVNTVRDVKKERVRRIRDEATQRCRAWLKETMPGTLSATTEGFGPPTCSLVSLAAGKPFAEAAAEYMSLLDLRLTFFTERFVHHDCLFLTRPSGGFREDEMIAVFNESEALGSGWISDLSTAPEIFHEEISSFMIAEGLNAVLLSFEPRLRDVRGTLNRLDFEKATGAQVVALRNRLLEISRDISIVSNDVTVLVDDAVMLWAELSPLVLFRREDDESATVERTADVKRQQLRSVMQSLQAGEAGLRELILVTSASISESRNLELQTKVLGLTSKLNGLTTWLIVLTVVLVILGVATLVVQVVNAPAATSQPSPRPSAHPSARRTTQPTPRMPR